MAAPSTANDPSGVLQQALQAARLLIGWTLAAPDGTAGIIVETEAYTRDDPASHSFNGETHRNRSMFLGAGHAYVYRSYGIHFCMNVVTGSPGDGAAVLLRALQPVAGLEAMARRRGTDDPRRLCSGPGRLCQALGIDARHDGVPLLVREGLRLTPPNRQVEPLVAVGTRIGITKAADWPRRFALAGSPYLSRPLRNGNRPPAPGA